jgi:putative spermidine/putrescine transport system substrate-binding protein
MSQGVGKALDERASRRLPFVSSLVVLTGVVLAAALAADASTAPNARPAAVPLEGTVVFAGPGGVYRDTFQKKIFTIFEKRTGVKVEYVAGGADANLVTIRAQRNRPTIDVFWGTALQTIRGYGLFEPLSLSRIPNKKLMQPGYKVRGRPAGIQLAGLAMGLFYNVAEFRRRGWPVPTSWNDLWNPRYRSVVGITTLPSAVSDSILVQIARLRGGSERNIGPGLARFAQLRPNLFAPPVQANQLDALIQQGNVLFGAYHGARVQQLAQQGVPIAFVKPKEGYPILAQTGSIVKGARNPAAAYALINFLLEPGIQRSLPANMGYGPVTRVPVAARYGRYVPRARGAKFWLPRWGLVVRNERRWTDEWIGVMGG